MEEVIDFHAAQKRIPLEAWITWEGAGGRKGVREKGRKLRNREGKRE